MSQALKQTSVATSLMRHCRKAARPLLLATAIALAGFQGEALADSSLTYQGVSFNTWTIDSDTLGFSILNATSASGDWAGIQSLKAFEFKEIGLVDGGTVVSGPGNFIASLSELNASGCTGGSAGGVCFTTSPAIALTDSMTWNIDFKGKMVDFSFPTLKVEFLDAAGSKQGSLLSQQLDPVTPVDEPRTYALLLAGIGMMTVVTRRRQRTQTIN